jgi:hypothetical protein
VGQELRPDISWPDISNYILEDNVLSDNHDEQEPLDILPTPLIQIEALAGPLLVILRGQSGKWNLQLENQGSVFLSQATIIFKPLATIAVAPRIVNKNKLASGERLSIETHITIRPNQRVINTTFQLKFDAVLLMEGQSKLRYRGILDIPIN